MSPEHMAFYSTAGTVIPVMALGSVLGTATLARAASSQLDKLGATVHFGLSELIEKELASLRQTCIGRVIVGTELFFLRLAFTSIGRRLVAPLLFVVFLLATLGEIYALMALASGHSDTETIKVVWLGLGASGLVALVPVVQTLIFLSAPFAAIGGALRKLPPSQNAGREPSAGDASEAATVDPEAELKRMEECDRRAKTRAEGETAE
jgi:hypothetical protein